MTDCKGKNITIITLNSAFQAREVARSQGQGKRELQTTCSSGIWSLLQGELLIRGELCTVFVNISSHKLLTVIENGVLKEAWDQKLEI